MCYIQKRAGGGFVKSFMRGDSSSCVKETVLMSGSQVSGSCSSVVEQRAAACCGGPVGVVTEVCSAVPGEPALGPGS